MSLNATKYIVFMSVFMIFTGCSSHNMENSMDTNQINKGNEISPPELNTSIPAPTIEKKVEPKKNPPAKTVGKKDATKKSNKTSLNNETDTDKSESAIKELNQKVKESKTREVREILNANPKAIDMIEESEKKLLYVGPSGWRVIDIIEGLRNGRLREKEIVSHIKAAKLPYKNYSYDEIQALLKQKIPFKVINTMMTVSK